MYARALLIRYFELTHTFSFTLKGGEFAYRPIDTPAYCGKPAKDCQVFPTLPACIFAFERERGAWQIRNRMGSESRTLS